jgi:hypothetical protein
MTALERAAILAEGGDAAAIVAWARSIGESRSHRLD